MEPNHEGARAVVIGASLAGLLAARVLADRYAEVTVFDRDRLPDYPDHRRGVPQAHHAHALLARGQQVLEELFPGITKQLAGRGAPTGDMLGSARLHFSGHRLRQGTSGLVLVSASRILLENEVRRRVRELPGVKFAPPSDVAGLVTGPHGDRVTGVRLLQRADGSAAETCDADLVVDASGRGSRAARWLEALGYDRPTEDRVRMELHYTSRRYRLAPDALGGDLASLQAATPANPRAGVLARLEGDQWLLTLAGILGDRAPADSAGFLAFARSLPFPDIHDAVRGGEPIDEPVSFRFPESVRFRYDRLTRLPGGFLPIGDSLCTFNPVYGQGMTVAALEALALRQHRQHAGAPAVHRILRDFARIIDTPWQMARGADLSFPGVSGKLSWPQRWIGRYIAHLHAAAVNDARLGIAFVRVSGLVDHPAALFRPRVALRVLSSAFSRPSKKSGSGH